jgi:hypothetical protein
MRSISVVIFLSSRKITRQKMSSASTSSSNGNGLVGVVITSYESDSPVITHIFWGESLDEAVSVAKSHLITDYFFSSTFVGELPWGEDVLKLTYNGRLINVSRFESQSQLTSILQDIATDAERINEEQRSLGMQEIVQDISELE